MKPPQPPRCRDDRGASLLETAITFPVFFLIISGIFEFGLLFRDYSLTGDAVADGARIGAIYGPATREVGGVTLNADYAIVQRVREGLGGISIDSIDRVVVFKANSPSFGSALDQVPNVCKTGGSSTGAQCNVYPAFESFQAIQNGNAAYFTCGGGGPACGWPPQSRDDGPQPLDIDYLGVYVKLDRPYITGIFGDELEIEVASLI